MKKSTIFFITALLSVLMLNSCESNGSTNNDAINYTVDISATVSANTAIVTFTPSENAVGTIYALGLESDRTAFSDSSMETLQIREDNQTFTIEFTGLDVNTIYTVFARAYDADNNKHTISSQKIQFGNHLDNVNLSIQYVSDQSAGIILEWDYNLFLEIEYYLGTSADRDDFHAGKTEGVSSIRDIRDYVFNYFDLEPEKDYVFFCRVYDRTNVLVDSREVLFTTYAEGSCPGIMSIDYTNDVYTGDYTFVPNEYCGKLVGFIAEAGVYDQTYLFSWNWNIKDMILSWYSGGTMGTQGADGSNLTFNFTTYNIETDFELESYIIAYNKLQQPFAVYRAGFATTANDPSLEAASVEIEVTNITSKGATYHITADDNTLLFYYDTVDADYFDNEIEGSESILFGRLSTESLPHHIPSDGRSLTVTEEGADSRTDYYIAVFAVNNNGINGGVSPVKMIRYTTL